MTFATIKLKLESMNTVFIDIENDTYIDVEIKGKVVVASGNEHAFTFVKGHLTVCNDGYIKHGLSKDVILQLESNLGCFTSGMQVRKTLFCNVIVPEGEVKKPALEE